MHRILIEVKDKFVNLLTILTSYFKKFHYK
jgi:hypothetical protein